MSPYSDQENQQPDDFDVCDEPLSNEQEDPVDLLYRDYQIKLQLLDDHPGVSEEMKDQGRELYLQDFVKKVSELPDSHRALQRAKELLDNQGSSYEDLHPNNSTRPQGNDSDDADEGLSTTDTTENRSNHGDNHDQDQEPSDFGSMSDDEVAEETTETADQDEHGLLQLLDVNNGETILNEKVLNYFCKEIGDRPVAVVATAGKFRGGKTFWNNVLLKGLVEGKASYQPNDRIGGRNQIRFQAGHERHTKGLLIWSKVFNRKDRFGNDVAVLLMDTQGTFDTSSDTGDSAVIFGVAIMLTSTLILNKKELIDAQDLDSLNLFITYSQKNNEKVGQHLILMLRDSLTSGFDPDYLDDIKKQTKKSPEMQELLKGILDAFEKVECFKVPTPTDKVRKATGSIKAKHCGPRFLDSLCGCANHVLDNLIPKLIMGTPLTGQTLKQYMMSVVEHIKADDRKGVGSAFAATSQLSFEKARSNGNDVFQKQHDELLRANNYQPMKPMDYEANLETMQQQAIQAYEKVPRFGSPESKEKECNVFKNSLEERSRDKIENNKIRYRDIILGRAVNESYQLYEREMTPSIIESLKEDKAKKLAHVEERHRKAFPDAMDNFDNTVEDFNGEEALVGSNRETLEKMIQTRYNDLKQENVLQEVRAKIDQLVLDSMRDFRSNLKKQESVIKDANDVADKLRLLQQQEKAEFTIHKLEFLGEYAMKLPDLDKDALEEMIDISRNARSFEFDRISEEFEQRVKSRLEGEAIKKQLTAEAAARRKAQAEYKKEKQENNKKIKGLEKEIDKKSKAAPQNDIMSYLLMMSQVDKQAAEQRDEMTKKEKEERDQQRRADKLEAERRDEQRRRDEEVRAQKDREFQFMLHELQMKREEESERLRREEKREGREDKERLRQETEARREREDRRIREAEAARIREEREKREWEAEKLAREEAERYRKEQEARDREEQKKREEKARKEDERLRREAEARVNEAKERQRREEEERARARQEEEEAKKKKGFFGGLFG